MEALGHARRQRDARAVAAFGRRGLARQQHGHHRAQQVGHRGAGLFQPVEVSADREALVADDGRAVTSAWKQAFNALVWNSGRLV